MLAGRAAEALLADLLRPDEVFFLVPEDTGAMGTGFDDWRDEGRVLMTSTN